MYVSFRKFSLALPVAVCLLTSAAAARAGTTTTTLTVTASGSPVTAINGGRAITLTATVLSAGAAVTPGVVNFCDASATYCTDVHLLGTAQLTGAGTAVIRLIPGTGSRSFKAVFAGTGAAAGSASASVSLTVGPILSTTSAVASGSSVTATVSGSALAPPTGTVVISDVSDGILSGTADLVANTGIGLSTRPSLTKSNINAAIPATGDFNNDGITDLVVTAGRGTSFLLGDGQGGFVDSDFHSVDLPRHLVSGDFNNDGNVDVAVTNNVDNSVAVFLGNGKGVFTAGSNPKTGSSPYAIATADFDGDGNADLAVENYGSNSVTILLGDGAGAFTAASKTVPTDTSPVSLITADFDGDGKADLAVLQGDAVNIFLGKGDGTFTAVTAVALTDGGVGIATADFDGDGKADLAVLQNGSVSLLLGKGDGTFTPTTSWVWSTGGVGIALAIADFNGDGLPDLAVLDDTNVLTEAFGKGDGTFPQSAISAAIFPYSTTRSFDSDPDPGPQILPGSFYKDGHADLAAMYYEFGPGVTSLQAYASSTATATGITLPINSGGQRIVAHYTGDTNYTGSAGAAYDGPFVSLSAMILTFAPIPVGDISGYQVVVVTNLGNQALNIGKVLITNTTDSYAWGIRQNNCGPTLLPAGSCSFAVVFRPTKTGKSTAMVSIDDNGQWLKQKIFLTGKGK